MLNETIHRTYGTNNFEMYMCNEIKTKQYMKEPQGRFRFHKKEFAFTVEQFLNASLHSYLNERVRMLDGRTGKHFDRKNNSNNLDHSFMVYSHHRMLSSVNLSVSGLEISTFISIFRRANRSIASCFCDYGSKINIFCKYSFNCIC